MWTRQRSSDSVRILQKNNFLIAISFTEMGIIYVSCGRNLKYRRSPTTFERTTTISIRSLATSSRRIPVEDQSMANLRDKLCSSRRKTCKEKQGIRRTEIIRRFSHGGKQLKNTENRWDLSVSETKISCFTTELLWRGTTIQLRKLNEYEMQCIGFSR